MKNKFAIGTGSIAVVALPLISTVACAGNEHAPNFRDDFISGNSWYVNSAEKQAMMKMIYKSAEGMFDNLKAQTSFDATKVKKAVDGKWTVKNPGQGKSIPVVFMDLDETVLDNSAYQNWNIVNGSSFSPTTWRNWVSISQAKKIEGSIAFIKHVWDGGGVVMFNSDRDQDQVAPTRANLVDLGLDASQLPDWVFWMQGVDPTIANPWEVSDNDHTKKEERMDAMNSKTDGFDTGATGADKVVLKTVMRVGDNLNDFNDLAYKHALNPVRVKALTDHIGANFGATDQLGKIYDADKKTWSDESWNEGYVLVGGNVLYGGWEEGLKAGYYTLSPEEQAKARRESITNSDHWNGQNDWKKKS